jgi:2-polyprenyl-3-methyl-5-hydroxy-6-metoxy-1,4-benzoquinol methylase
VEQASLFDLDGSFDVVHAASVLHHFDGSSAGDALAKMFALARAGVVVNDLHRTPLAWIGARIAARLFTTSRLVRNDAPLSTLRAFTRADFVELCRSKGLPEPEIAWRAMFRWRVVIRRTQIRGEDGVGSTGETGTSPGRF